MVGQFITMNQTEYFSKRCEALFAKILADERVKVYISAARSTYTTHYKKLHSLNQTYANLYAFTLKEDGSILLVKLLAIVGASPQAYLALPVNPAHQTEFSYPSFRVKENDIIAYLIPC